MIEEALKDRCIAVMAPNVPRHVMQLCQLRATNQVSNKHSVTLTYVVLQPLTNEALSDATWVNSKFLNRVWELLLQICACVLTSNEEYTQLDDDQWHMILAFQTDQTNLLNKLILELQGKDKTYWQLSMSKAKLRSSKMQCILLL